MALMSTKGIACPDCGGKPLVTNRYYPLPGQIVRYRTCRKCGRKIRTRERVIMVSAVAIKS
jgi:DNA-directed RNA polymerase subunit RPC12/RpoP